MRILHLIDHLGPGGAQELVLELLRRADRTLFEFEVAYLFGAHHYAPECRDQGTIVTCIGNAPYRTTSFLDPSLWWRLCRFLAQNKWDIVHIHLYVAAVYGTVVARLVSGAKVIITVHAIRDQLPAYVLPFFRIISPFVDLFVGDLTLIGQELVSAGVPEHKVKVIPLGVDVDSFADDFSPVKDIRAEFRLPSHSTILLNIGRFHPQKGQINLVRAMRRVSSECPSAFLLLVGTGETEAILREEAAKLGLSERVIFAGFRRDLRDLFRNADIVVLAPEQEALGMVTLEALASGRPVVATDVGAMSEAIIHGRTGILVPRGDMRRLETAILDLIRSPTLRESLGERGRQLVRECFSISGFVFAYEKLYASLAGCGI